MPRKQHTHKYMLATTGSSPVWRCALPDCGHFMPNHLTSLVVGRSSICWHCENKFTLDEIAMKNERPQCINCRSGVPVEEKEKDISHLAEFLKDRGI